MTVIKGGVSNIQQALAHPSVTHTAHPAATERGSLQRCRHGCALAGPLGLVPWPRRNLLDCLPDAARSTAVNAIARHNQPLQSINANRHEAPRRCAGFGPAALWPHPISLAFSARSDAPTWHHNCAVAQAPRRVPVRRHPRWSCLETTWKQHQRGFSRSVTPQPCGTNGPNACNIEAGGSNMCVYTRRKRHKGEQVTPCSIVRLSTQGAEAESSPEPQATGERSGSEAWGWKSRRKYAT